MSTDVLWLEGAPSDPDSLERKEWMLQWAKNFLKASVPSQIDDPELTI
jgi:hypothetical protein